MARFFCTTSRGTEEALTAELEELGIADVESGRGVVSFFGELEQAYRACLWSRIASRVLRRLVVFEVDGPDALYDGIHAVDWTAHLGSRQTLAVDVAGKDSPAGPGHFVTLKAKDAIVDRIREAEGARPDVDTVRPDVRVNLHVHRNTVSVNLDLSGRGMHRRGIDRAATEAPMKENLAAAILRIAGWPQRCREPLFDPMCGSGTFLVEAAWTALDVAPGLQRKRMGATSWRGHDAVLWRRLTDEARDRQHAGRDRELRIAGADASASAIDTARENLARAGLAGRVRLQRRELARAEPPWNEPGLFVTNPPYGERLGESGELVPLYQELGDVLKRRFPGWSAWVFTGNPALGKRIGLRPASRRVLFNGPIESRLLEIPISERPAAGATGPGWRKPSAEVKAFAGRLRKNLDELRPWAEAEGLTAYRLYDSDVPEYNVAVDWYDGAVRVEEYARPRKVAAEDAERRLRDVMLVLPELLGIASANVVLRVRRRLAPGEQHQRRGDRGAFRTVREGELRFRVNLTDYLDTGLFLDDRLLRRRIRERASGAGFLNLFAYTCAASVAATVGGARSTTSVDLSRTYLEWGRRNFALNAVESGDHRFVRADALEWLRRRGSGRRYDLIFVAPPTSSRSKAMQGDFDVQRDHAWLLGQLDRFLAPRGEILFAVNLRGFEMAAGRQLGLDVDEITDAVTPRDFLRRPRTRAWCLSRPAVTNPGAR